MAAEEEKDETAEAPAEEAAEGAAAEEAAAAEAAAPEADAGEPAEQLSPKQLRKRRRAQHKGEARPPRTPEERAAVRKAERARKAELRRKRRAAARANKGERREGTPPRERKPGVRRYRQGTVVSAKPDKTITVRVDIVRRHRRYEKVVRTSTTLHAHDERNEAHEGDVVRVVESRPLSRTKRWRLVEILERAR